MTWGNQLLRPVLALVLAASALGALTTPARAAATSCVARYTDSGSIDVPVAPAGGFTVNWFDIVVPDNRVVTDLDYGFDVTWPGDSSKLRLLLTGPQSKDGLEPSSEVNLSTGPLSGSYEMDDEAALAFATASPPAGRYRPTRPASNLEGQPAEGRWRLWINNVSNTDSGSVRNFTLTLTFATCDSDGDGHEDATDNCRSIPNDQANRDGDSLGDACDLDIDDDALANAVDGCPTAAARTTSGCPTVGREAALRYVTSTRKLKIRVGSAAAGCRAGARATLFRVRPGKDVKLLVATTDARGRSSVKAPRKAGRYYVRVASSYAAGEAECAAAKSPARKVRR